ncbi:hypothetical protein K504DRAFT_466407 [Pleomassaria siparia CBS 279.74]|uniref:Uncharacterized protein n=1 Tax=Pleomassaria siparia CBS 279.74 TaxID=1314801 RepID=A0A6G1KAQ3_9PLEO|nr:hypothetical protein K504DRAFT_466407 [Pleomassaria siparia CBS 279.74]
MGSTTILFFVSLSLSLSYLDSDSDSYTNSLLSKVGISFVVVIFLRFGSSQRLLRGLTGICNYCIWSWILCEIRGLCLEGRAHGGLDKIYTGVALFANVFMTGKVRPCGDLESSGRARGCFAVV